MPPETLATTQRWFWRLISAPTGVVDGKLNLAQEEPDVVPLSRWLVFDDEQTATERLDIYANMYFYRILDVIRGDYPRLLELIGDKEYDQARKYQVNLGAVQRCLESQAGQIETQFDDACSRSSSAGMRALDSIFKNYIWSCVR